MAPKESNDYCFVIRSGAVDISSEGDSDSVAVLLDRREAQDGALAIPRSLEIMPADIALRWSKMRCF